MSRAPERPPLPKSGLMVNRQSGIDSRSKRAR